jgi:hypothetical protein
MTHENRSGYGYEGIRLGLMKVPCQRPSRSDIFLKILKIRVIVQSGGLVVPELRVAIFTQFGPISGRKLVNT